MTNPNDLIRRGDALDLTRDPFGKETTTSKAITALPAAPVPPEVLALVEALRNAIAAIDAAYDGPDDNGQYSTRERTAIAAWEASRDR